MKRIVFLTCGFFSLFTLLLAQTKPTPEPVKGPTLSDSVKASFWKAQSKYQEATDAAKDANQKAQQAQVNLQAVVDQMKAECGKDFMPSMVGDDVGCIAKPQEPTKAAGPAKK